MVLTVLTALASRVSAEIEHIPYVSCPHIRSVSNLLDKLFVVVCLIFFGVVTLFRIGGVPVKSFTTVFGASDWLIWILCMELVEPRTVHGSIAAVPTEVVVVGNDIGNLQIGIIHFAH